jgi:hypothetical protein
MSQLHSHRPPTPDPFIPQPENLILPDGPVSERTAELLADLARDHEDELEDVSESSGNYSGQPDADAAYHLRKEYTRHLPWWKRPSPWW